MNRIPKFLASLVALFLAADCSADVESLYRSFRNPPRSDSLMPYWFWNGTLTAAESRRQMREMIAQGVHQAVVFPWGGMKPDYLSEDYWQQVGAALDTAKQLGFTLNFADEYFWPSGHAWLANGNQPELSRVLQAHPEFRMHRLECSEQTVEGPTNWTWRSEGKLELLVAAREEASGGLAQDSFTNLPTSGERIEWSVPPGRWVITSYKLTPAVGAHNTRVDLLNPAATKVYLDMVYEEFARRFPQHLGKTLKLTVADHEGAYGAAIAWTPRLWAEFQTRKGYDLRRVLPLLTRQSADGKFGRRVRQDYFEVISALYAEAFTRQVTDWCSRHGLQHAMSAYEEQFFFQVNYGGDMFQNWRTGTAVFIDALLERARMPIDFKEAVSVAHFDPKPLLVENQGLQGHATFFSLEKARLGSNMALLWGANRLIPYFDYDPHKIQWPPQWFLGQPTWRYFHHYAAIVNRAQFMNGQGAHVAPVLIYHPRESAFANADALLNGKPRRNQRWGNIVDRVQDFYSALQLELTRGGWDYHIADSHYLERAEIRDGALRLADESFRVLILPPQTDMAEGAQRQVRRFVKAGGVVLTIGELPDELDAAGIRCFPAREHEPFMDKLDYLEYIQTPTGIREDLKPLLETLKQVEPPQVEIHSDDRERVYFSHRRQDGVDWYWVVNDTERERQVVLRIPGEGHFEKWDAETGERWALPAKASGNKSAVALTFGPHDAFFVVRHDGRERAKKLADDGPEETLLTLPLSGWRFTPEAPRLEVPYAQIEGEAEPLWLAPERLSQREWWLIGPFPYGDHEGFFREFPPERDFKPDAKYVGANGEVSWEWCVAPDYIVRPREAMKSGRGAAFGVYYAFANVWSPTARRAKLSAAFADSLSVWWNDELKLSKHQHPKWVLLRDCWAETRDIEVRQGWNTVRLKLGPSFESQTGFLFRLTDESGVTLRDAVFAREQTLLAAEAHTRRQLAVAIPPGATSLEVPAFRKLFRLVIDGQAVAAVAGAKARFPASAKACVFEIESGDEPERPVSFASGTVPFTLQCWTDSALAHYSGTAIYETEFELPAMVRHRKLALDLGEVGLAAEVWLNGKKIGERAWRPFRFEISRAVRPGKNTLRIRVANSNAGWQSQGGTIYGNGSWGLKYNTERDRLATLHPNGLEGPVRLLSTSAATKKSAPATGDRAMLDLVRRYADTMIKHGRDRYGRVHSPLFASALDRKTPTPPTNPPPAPEGIREGDRTLSGGNPMHDENFYRVLYTLSEVTGDRRYAKAADDALRFFFTHCQSEATGLLAWGEHLGWDFQTEGVLAERDKHEFYRPWALWDKSWTLAPEACRCFAGGLWENQISDHATGNFSRHASFVRHGPERDNEFPRHAGFYIATWAEAYARTRDANFLHAIEVLVNSFEQRRHPDGSFPSASSHPDVLWWNSDLAWAVDVWSASANVPEPLASRMHQAALKTDAAFQHHFERGLSELPSDLWAIGYGKSTTAADAMGCLERWRQTRDENYRKLVLQAAEAYLAAEPPPNAVLYPGVFGDVISLLVTSGQMTGESRFMDRADALAEQAIRLFWNDGPLPRAATNLDHYEAITRADTLALALLQLWSAHTRPDRPLRVEWIDR